MSRNGAENQPYTERASGPSSPRPPSWALLWALAVTAAGGVSAAGQAGAFIGPLLGALLLAVDFRTTCLAGAAVFVLILAGHVG